MIARSRTRSGDPLRNMRSGRYHLMMGGQSTHYPARVWRGAQSHRHRGESQGMVVGSQRAVARRRRAGGGAAHTLRCGDAGVWRRRDAMKLSISAAHKVAWHAYVTRNLRLHPLIGYVGTCAFTREGAYTFIYVA